MMSIQPVDALAFTRGLHFHYRRWEPSASEVRLPPILLIHGLASASHIWNLVAPMLAQQGYSVIAVDQRGHGLSDKPDTGYEFNSIVADDRGIIETLPIERPVLVGHSWGAAVALDYAATFPEDVAALVLVDGAAGQLSLRPGWTREQALEDLAPPRFSGTARDTFLAYFKSGPLGQQWSPALEDIALNIVQLREDNTVAPRLSFENHLQIINAMWDQPTFDLYLQVTCPITLIVAEQQPTNENQERFARLRREGLERIRSLRPDATIIHMADTIHDIPLQRPRELAEEIMRCASRLARV